MHGKLLSYREFVGIYLVDIGFLGIFVAVQRKNSVPRELFKGFRKKVGFQGIS